MRNGTDSGMLRRMNGINTIGAAAKRKTDCQPWTSISDFPSTAASTPPTQYPLNISAAYMARMRFGEYSVIRAITLRITPPMPRPATKRDSATVLGSLVRQIGRADVRTHVTNEQLVCRLLLATKNAYTH